VTRVHNDKGTGLKRARIKLVNERSGGGVVKQKEEKEKRKRCRGITFPHCIN
jgi:hypothetical protein